MAILESSFWSIITAPSVFVWVVCVCPNGWEIEANFATRKKEEQLEG